MRVVRNQGVLVVTHHNQPEAVVLSVDHYQELECMAQRGKVLGAMKLAELNARFDQRLACLNGPQAQQALSAFMDDCLG